jgi:hypothetical protein
MARRSVAGKRVTARKSSKREASTPKDSPRADRPFAPGYGIVGTQEGKGLLRWTWVAKKMKCRTFWLITIHASAKRPHVMPVWGVWVDDAFFFSTARKSRKGQNLAANAACAVTNDDGEEAVIVEGIAAPLADPALEERVAAAYQKKYKMDPRSMKEPIFRVQPTKVFGFVEKTFPQSATRWQPR